ncbi:Peptidoglycan O-acetyltransferase [Posidoniimonas polymericola]|uniref:Peptidoglycan O-acetyltransferase n=1 Tax=Posidoniimonas polymericola TaxID=2528002 RepID=A0A5C5XVJ1_9BACT|nr:MBOAT family O-acyltransferase [Posidoniimonas polymericola]TWT66910.1 Peptidoglycan O-acetyltransferase [Posidoniimonas polymericola]
MLFNSYIFVFAFLPLTLLLWWSLPRGGATRLGLLVTASYMFYGWWDWRFLGLMALSTLIDYFAGHRIALASTLRAKRFWLTLSLVSNLGLLAVFKYAGFAAQSWNAIADWVHHGGLVPTPQVILPVGISFYTFQTISYSVDLYRGNAKPAASLLHFAAYVSMFPQLIAGPIVRYSDIDEQLRCIDRPLDAAQFASGVWMFVVGLAQKLLLADVIASRVDPLLDPHQTLQLAAGWYAMLGYSCQLYFDFAGYSNMAVGLGRMLGFEFCQNFDSPYKADSIQDFWRRWHISLSTMLRDYLFIPLGGSRGALVLTLRNLFVVMLLGGLWHGAGWTFVLWGAYHGVLLAIAAVWRTLSPKRLPYPAAAAVTFVAVVFGWVLFRCETLTHAWATMAAMVGLNGVESAPVLAVGGAKAAALLATLLSIAWFAPNAWRMKLPLNATTGVAAALVFVLCVLRFDSASPFLYFRF